MPDGLFRYEVQRNADLTPEAVGASVKERFGGTVITSSPLTIPENGLLPLTPEAGLLLSSDKCTIGHFQREHGKDRGTQEKGLTVNCQTDNCKPFLHLRKENASYYLQIKLPSHLPGSTLLARTSSPS